MADRPLTKGEWNKRWPKSIKRYTDLYTDAYFTLDPTAQEVLRGDPRLHERAGRDAAHRAHAHQPQAAQVRGPARLAGAPPAGRSTTWSRSSPRTTSSSSTSPTSTTWDGDPEEFYDGVHMTTEQHRQGRRLRAEADGVAARSEAVDRALQQLRLPPLLPPGGRRPLLGDPARLPAPALPDRRLVRLLRPLGLALPAAAAGHDAGGLGGRALHRADASTGAGASSSWPAPSP